MLPRLNDASLRRGLLNELIVIINDPLEVITAIVQLPQLLVNRGLVVQDINDEFFVNILARAGSVLQYFF